jgi:excisionase family DNA binding protein
VTVISPSDRLAVSPTEAAELIGASRKYVFDCIESGLLRSVKRGGRRFVTGAALEAFLDDTPAPTSAA